jgi:hypothetical protein
MLAETRKRIAVFCIIAARRKRHRSAAIAIIAKNAGCIIDKKSRIWRKHRLRETGRHVMLHRLAASLSRRWAGVKTSKAPLPWREKAEAAARRIWKRPLLSVRYLDICYFYLSLAEKKKKAHISCYFSSL